MSFYGTYTVNIHIPDKKEWDFFVGMLRKGGWIKGNDLTDEMDSVVVEDAVSEEMQKIEFETVMVRNFHHALHYLATKDEVNQLFVKKQDQVAWEGEIICTSSDGCFEGDVTTPDSYYGRDLDEYAQDALGMDTDYEDDDRSEYQWEVELAFHENPYKTKNSVDFITEEEEE